MTMKITATGDAILIQGFPEGGYEGFDEIRSFIARGDARIGNLETTVTDWDTYASTYCGGTWISTKPRILDQYLSLGLNFLGFANNHTMDMGPDGMLETLRNLEKRNVTYAGAGKDLASASAPAYRTFQSGRVAFLAISATFDDAARAGYASRTTIGRPGLNPLRKTVTAMVSPEHFRALTEILDNTGLEGAALNGIRDGFSPKWPEGTLKIGKTQFARTEGREEKVSKCSHHDLERIRDAVKDAHLIADYVVVMLHDHAIKADKMWEPDDAAKEFAHFCIDEGVDAVIGTGTHQFKPIEFYRGKPIFYSLGNFCFQSNVLEHQPYDMLERFNFPEMTDVQGLARRNSGWTVRLHTQFYNFRTVIPYLEYDKNRLVKAELKPVELGFEKSRTFKGIPYPANERQTKEIFERLKELSEPYGTALFLRDDGIIEIKPDGTD